MRYDQSVYGEAGFYGAGGKLLFNTVGLILTAGSSSAIFNGTASIGEKVFFGMDVIGTSDDFIGWSDYLPEDLKRAYGAIMFLTGSASLLKSATDVMRTGNKLDFFDKAGFIIGSYNVIAGIGSLTE